MHCYRTSTLYEVQINSMAIDYTTYILTVRSVGMVNAIDCAERVTTGRDVDWLWAGTESENVNLENSLCMYIVTDCKILPVD